MVNKCITVALQPETWHDLIWPETWPQTWPATWPEASRDLRPDLTSNLTWLETWPNLKPDLRSPCSVDTLCHTLATINKNETSLVTVFHWIIIMICLFHSNTGHNSTKRWNIKPQHASVILTHETETFSALIGVRDYHAVSRTLMEQATSETVNTPLSAINEWHYWT